MDEIIRALNEAQGLNMPVDELLRTKEGLYREMLPQLLGIPEVLEHIDRSYGVIPFAVVSGGPRRSVEASLECAGHSGTGSRCWYARESTPRASRILSPS